MDSMRDINQSGNADYGSEERMDGMDGGGEGKKTLMAGVIGAAVASVGYMIYSRLEESQKQAIRSSVTKFVEDKVADVRSQLKI
ncbi:MAG: hypothetical protein GIX02_03615 [Candidatus Eremiobacteraeota bacterium]|nr:hypothetical protein [Candidatus Eremiobacteraeota bacterium]